MGFLVAGAAAGEATLYAGPAAGGAILGGANTALQGGNASQIVEGTFVGGFNGALSQVGPKIIPFGNSDFGLTIAPQIAVGTDGFGVGFNSTVGYNYNGFSAGVNFRWNDLRYCYRYRCERF